MTVKELKELLNKYNEDAIIVCASDSEGNQVSPLMEYEDGILGESNRYSIDGVAYTYTSGEDFLYIDLEKNKGKQYIVLYPTL